VPSQPRTNVVIVMVDNQSADALGCYGNAEARTPHIDRLAAEGTQFDQAYCPNALCSPGRASVLTGLLPSGHGVHSWLEDRLIGEWPPEWSAIDEFPTLPQLAHEAGYSTALIGKHHLGVPNVPQNGFEHWVALRRGHTLSFYDTPVIKDGVEISVAEHSVDFLTAEAVAYIEARAATPDVPFFLFLTYNGPYGHWPAIKGRAANRFAADYDDCAIESVPRGGLSQAAIDYVRLQQQFGHHGPGAPDYDGLLKIPNDVESLRNYYSQSAVVDAGVGAVMATLERCSLDDDTLVIYMADHGFALGQRGFWGHGVATWPANAHRVAYNVPLIWRQPQRIARDAHCPALVSNTDLYASLLAYLELEHDPPASSRSFVPLLAGMAAERDDAVFIDEEETRAIRTPDWLYVKRFRGSTGYPLRDELFALGADPRELHDLADDPAHADVIGALGERIDRFFAANADPRFDLWNGGAPKSSSSRPWIWRDAWGDAWTPRRA
jgi:arylsulfatase A-like enzyme